MNAQIKKTKVKTRRPSKGMRKHNRRVKQEARRVNAPTTGVNRGKRPA